MFYLKTSNLPSPAMTLLHTKHMLPNSCWQKNITETVKMLASWTGVGLIVKGVIPVYCNGHFIQEIIIVYILEVDLFPMTCSLISELVTFSKMYCSVLGLMLEGC